MNSELDSDGEIRKQFKDIEARLARIENRLGILRSVSSRATAQESRPTLSDSTNTSASTAPALSAPISGAAKPRLNLERLLGERVIAWVGALIVVAGVGLFVKLAYDQGWLRFPPLARCAMGGVFGALLLVAGEVLRKRVSPVAGAGSFASGIGTLFASTFAAYELYHLLPLSGAFLILGSIAAIGVAISLRSRLVSVGVVGFLCAYLTPVLLWSDVRSPFLLPAYLLMVLASSLVIARRDPSRHTYMRWVGWGGTVAIGTAWIMDVTGDTVAIPCAFLGLTWLAIQLDLLVQQQHPADPIASRHTSRFANVSFAITAWASLLALLVVSDVYANRDWLAPSIMSAACMSLGIATRVRVVGPPGTDTTQPTLMIASLFSQSGGLVLLAIGVGLSGPALPLTWLSLGIASAVVSRRVRHISLATYAVVSLGLATLDLFVYEPLVGELFSGGRSFHGLILSPWTACVWAAGAAWIAVAALLKWLPPSRRRSIAQRGAAIGPALTFASLLHEQARSNSLAWAWTGLAVLWLAATRLVGRRVSVWIGALGAALASVPWTMSFVGRQWFHTGMPLGLHEGLWGGLAIGVTFAACGRRARREPLVHMAMWHQMSALCNALAVLVVLTATSHEAARIAGVLSGVPHARAAAVSIWWALFGTGMIALGFVRSLAGIRHAGLALLYVAGGKLVLLDFSQVSASWRVAAFIGIGLLMLLVGVGYARLSRVLERDISNNGGRPDEGV